MQNKYILFYKPFQVLSQFTDIGNKKALGHFFPNIEKDIYPIGRLDYDSEGLLLLTNDKKFHHQLLQPKNKHSKTYAVQVEGVLDKKALEQLEKGVEISLKKRKHFTAPAKARILEKPIFPDRNPPIRYRANIPTSWLELSITEGKNRQVRKMTAKVGFPTLRLIRTHIGDLSLEGLQPGEYKHLAQNEAQKAMRRLKF